jgi:hypothetical protein
MRIAAVSLLVAALVPFVVPSSVDAAVGPDITALCNGSTCTGNWYTVTVSLSWQVTPQPGTTIVSQTCTLATISSDTAAAGPFHCSATDSNGVTTSASVTIKRDATPPTVTGSAPSRGPDANGWYNHVVTVTFSGSDATSGIASCSANTYNGPDSSNATVTGTCTDQAGNTSATSSATLKYDSTPPSVSLSRARGPDANGWYNHSVGFAASGSDGLSGVASCGSATYSGPDGAGVSVGARCTDNAGNVGSAGTTINYDATAPTVTGATPARAPDANDWYNHPVDVTFAGRDAASGISSCTTVTYKGPDGPAATLNGSCVDNAGNSGSGSVTLKYDSTPPTLTGLAVVAGDSFATLTWRASSDTTEVKVERTPGPQGPDAGVVFTGLASTYDDTTVVNKVRYLYTVTAYDDAGNTAVQTISVVPASPLYSPARGADVKGPPLLAWKPAAHATYYNVQVFRGSVKVLSTWPPRARFRMKRRWTYRGKRLTLTPGDYRWYVWPGFGKLSRRTYGPLIGKSDFVVIGR